MSLNNYNANNYIELNNIIPVGEWILYEKYLEIWDRIWEFIQDIRKKFGSNAVWINNFGYNYMDTKQFYFSWKQKSAIIGGILVKHAKFDYLDINHEDIRHQKWEEEIEQIDKEKEESDDETKALTDAVANLQVTS